MSRRGWVLFAAMSLIWGIPYLLIKVADGGVSVPGCWCSSGSRWVPCCCCRSRCAAVELGALRGRWRWLVAFAVVEIVGPFVAALQRGKALASSTAGC